MKEPVREFSREEIKKLGLRYYNSDIHRAAFVLPEFARQVSFFFTILVWILKTDVVLVVCLQLKHMDCIPAITLIMST